MSEQAPIQASPATARTLPQLPTELWLQILENINDPSYLWTTLRSFSSKFEAYVEQVFFSIHLPSIVASPSLPRRDPNTNTLRYAQDAPQLILQYAGLTADKSRLILATPTLAQNGANMECLNVTGVLSQRRLEEAVLWVSLGCSRAQAVPMEMEKSMMWDDGGKVWLLEVEWRKFVSSYFEVKRDVASRRAKKPSRRGRLGRKK